MMRFHHPRLPLLALALLALLPACGRSPSPPVPAMALQSAAFTDGQRLSTRFTADGPNLSPPLNWSGVPAGTKQLALICDDPDAPRPEPWVHWVIYNLPPTTTGLPENMLPAAPTTPGLNSWNKTGYAGPSPPRGSGPHRYVFTLYALDLPPGLPTNLDKAELLNRMQGHILAQGRIQGLYER